MEGFEKPKESPKERTEISKEKKRILSVVKENIEKSEDILAARAYGSWLHSPESIDLDINTLIPSEKGIVDSGIYRRLKLLRKQLSERTNQDIDLVPHTQDEIDDLRSPLYYPRYNPSLVFGNDIKGSLEVKPVYEKTDKFGFDDLTVYVLHDNRTICRRQLVRSLTEEESRIFVSKILHGPGNALTYYSCKNKEPYLVSPSDLQRSLEIFDKVYEVDSKPVLKFLESSKKELNFEKALRLIKWYEHLVRLVLYEEKHAQDYQEFSKTLSLSE